MVMSYIKYYNFNNTFAIMNIIQVTALIFITTATCFLAFQFWYYIENYDYILKYNNTYSNLEYARSANINYDDRTVYDPNDNIFIVDEKWRCAENNRLFYALSEFGFLSTESTGIHLVYTHFRDCILDLFSRQTKIVYNACAIPTSADCNLLQNLLRLTS
jgi:hypothetical protein